MYLHQYSICINIRESCGDFICFNVFGEVLEDLQPNKTTGGEHNEPNETKIFVWFWYKSYKRLCGGLILCRLREFSSVHSLKPRVYCVIRLCTFKQASKTHQKWTPNHITISCIALTFTTPYAYITARRAVWNFLWLNAIRNCKKFTN